MKKHSRLPVPSKKGKQRRGFILLAVLIVLVVLSLAAYQFSDLMTSEYRAAHNAHRTVQARLLADSGIHYTAALLSNPDNVNELLNGNIWNNSQYFLDIEIPTADGSGNFGRFTLVAPLDATSEDISQGCRYGVMDEGAKINPNVLMQLDPSGNRLYTALMKLPNMTSTIANSIVDWIDPDSTVREGGAEDDHYGGMAPPSRCKNGALESVEEMLLIQGVTPLLLFGSDVNRNGIIDPEEDSSYGQYDFGWSAFLTVYSREQNRDPYGSPYVFLNDDDLTTLYDNVTAQVDESFAKFLILYRQFGTPPAPAAPTVTANVATGTELAIAAPAPLSTASQASPAPVAVTLKVATQTPAAPAAPAAPAIPPIEGDLGSVELDLTKPSKLKVASIFELVGAVVTVPATKPNTPATVFVSPLADPGTQRDLLGRLFSTSTVMQGNEIPARINVNTASQEVLATIPELSEEDLQKILSTRPNLSSSEPPEDVFQTPAWLLTEAQLAPATLIQLEKYLTTSSQVFRVQVVGYFDNNGPSARVEAVIDTNGGRPRIVMWRDLTPLGKGWNKPQ